MTSQDQRIAAIKDAIASYPNFPKEGVIFRDVFAALRKPELFQDIIELFAEQLGESQVTVEAVVSIEARGFIFGAPLALKLKVPFIPVRKPGKLPGVLKRETYSLEYGVDSLEVQLDAISKGLKVVVIDDLMATGGTMKATVKLVESLGGCVQMCLAVMELEDLRAKDQLHTKFYSLMKF